MTTWLQFGDTYVLKGTVIAVISKGLRLIVVQQGAHPLEIQFEDDSDLNKALQALLESSPQSAPSDGSPPTAH